MPGRSSLQWNTASLSLLVTRCLHCLGKSIYYPRYFWKPGPLLFLVRPACDRIGDCRRLEIYDRQEYEMVLKIEILGRKAEMMPFKMASVTVCS
jgi:hypothetical protein